MSTPWDFTQVVTVVVVGGYALARFIWRDVQSLLQGRNGGTFETKSLAALGTLTDEVRGMRQDLQNGFERHSLSDARMQAELTTMAREAVRDISAAVEQSAAKLDVLLDRGR